MDMGIKGSFKFCNLLGIKIIILNLEIWYGILSFYWDLRLLISMSWKWKGYHCSAQLEDVKFFLVLGLKLPFLNSFGIKLVIFDTNP